MSYVIGADEVGRGSLAGDVFVAGVMAPADLPPIEGVTDSKQVTPFNRDRLHGVLIETAGLHYRIARRTAEDIDGRGMVVCLRECFTEVIEGLLSLKLPVERIRVDGDPLDLKVERPVEYLVRGDSLDWVIGAASIIAKVERDRYMTKLADEFPGYGWAKNAGYGTKEHTKGIKLRGLTTQHRRTFCKNFMPEPEVDVFTLFS